MQGSFRVAFQSYYRVMSVPLRVAQIGHYTGPLGSSKESFRLLSSSEGMVL